MSHYGHEVWDDENGDIYFMSGHVPERRAIAAANRYCRVDCGLDNLLGEHGAPLKWVTVRHVYYRYEPSPDNEYDMVRTVTTDLWAKPFTEVSV